jgi:hypothetical protein
MRDAGGGSRTLVAVSGLVTSIATKHAAAPLLGGSVAASRSFAIRSREASVSDILIHASWCLLSLPAQSGRSGVSMDDRYAAIYEEMYAGRTGPTLSPTSDAVSDPRIADIVRGAVESAESAETHQLPARRLRADAKALLAVNFQEMVIIPLRLGGDVPYDELESDVRADICPVGFRRHGGRTGIRRVAGDLGPRSDRLTQPQLATATDQPLPVVGKLMTGDQDPMPLSVS